VYLGLEGQQRDGQLGAAHPLSLVKQLKQLGVHQCEPWWSRSVESVGNFCTRRPPNVFPSGETFAQRPLSDAIALGKHVHRDLVLHMGDQEEPLFQGEGGLLVGSGRGKGWGGGRRAGLHFSHLRKKTAKSQASTELDTDGSKKNN